MKKKSKLKKVTNNKEYKVILKSIELYRSECYICSRRRGRYHEICWGDQSNNKFRQYRSWKYNRNTQYKTIYR